MEEQQHLWLERIKNLFMRYGVRNVTMDDVARELGISKKTLYQFVSSKDELVEQVVLKHIIEEKKQDMCVIAESQNAVDEILKLIDLGMNDIQQMKTNIVFELQRYFYAAWRHIEAYRQEHMSEYVRRNLERGIAEGLYRADLDVELVARLHVASTFNVFDENWFPRADYPPEKVIRTCYLLYLNGIISDQGRQFLKEKLSDQL
ncbi:MAG: TetR/AcrR family transcriptional regulator [Saprospiraceae bacterium]